jgi:hypothetical protein
LQVLVFTDRAATAEELSYLEQRTVVVGQKQGKDLTNILAALKQKISAYTHRAA